eukprot:TCONS_00032666-protein
MTAQIKNYDDLLKAAVIQKEYSPTSLSDFFESGNPELSMKSRLNFLVSKGINLPYGKRFRKDYVPNLMFEDLYEEEDLREIPITVGIEVDELYYKKISPYFQPGTPGISKSA